MKFVGHVLLLVATACAATPVSLHASWATPPSVQTPSVAQSQPQQGAARPRRVVTPEERARIESAIPARAPVSPAQPRRLLIFDLNVDYGGHASIPYANLALQLMGTRTGAFEATLSSDPAMLEAANLGQFDAVYLNNTVGDIFSTPELREAFSSYVANGGGLVAHHAVTVTSTGWEEFGRILGARGAAHRAADEQVVITVDDPDNPIVRAFGGRPFEYADEIFRFQTYYSRDNVRVLLSLDRIETNMTQGRCTSQCLRDDNDYAIAWIRQHGKGRVFYTALGHNPYVFWDPPMLEMLLAAVQYALGDLQADPTPRPRTTQSFDNALAAVARYDWGQDRTSVQRFEREIAFMASNMAGAEEAETKMIAVLEGDAPLGAKDVICRQLAIFGSRRSEPALRRMLEHGATRAMALTALQGILAAPATLNWTP